MTDKKVGNGQRQVIRRQPYTFAYRNTNTVFVPTFIVYADKGLIICYYEIGDYEQIKRYIKILKKFADAHYTVTLQQYKINNTDRPRNTLFM